MSCEPLYGGGNTGCTVPTQPVTTTVVSHPVPHTHTDLPFTGGDIVGGLMLGLGALVGGIALVRSGRRKAV